MRYPNINKYNNMYENHYIQNGTQESYNRGIWFVLRMFRLLRNTHNKILELTDKICLNIGNRSL